jgi:hypothetical protein
LFGSCVSVLSDVHEWTFAQICLVIVQIPVETSLSEWAYGIPKAPVEPESSVIL